MTMLQEFARCSNLYIEIMIVDVRTELDALQLYIMLPFFCILKLLCLLVPVFPVIYDLADGRFCLSSDLNKIQFSLARCCKCILQVHYPNLFTVRSD